MSNQLDIAMDQGSSLKYTFTLQAEGGAPFDITGYDARLQIRRSYGATGTAPISATLANNKIVLTDPANGVLELRLSPADTSGIAFASKEDESFEMVYDLEIQSPSSKVYKPARGTFTLAREVTR